MKDENAVSDAPELTIRDPRTATFRNAALARAHFDDVDLSGATIENTNLSGATLRDVNLSGAELTDVDLSDVTIVDANITGLTINGVDIGALLGETSPEPAPTASRGIQHIDLPTPDPAASARFYGALFGWECSPTDGGTATATFQAGPITGGFPHIHGGLASVTGAMRAGDTILYVPSDDLEADLIRAETLGGTVLLPRTAVADGLWIALLCDPYGARLALTTRRTPSMGSQ
jgi:predicted enzyme related to lactoylglutathione lyase